MSLYVGYVPQNHIHSLYGATSRFTRLERNCNMHLGHLSFQCSAAKSWHVRHRWSCMNGMCAHFTPCSVFDGKVKYNLTVLPMRRTYSSAFDLREKESLEMSVMSYRYWIVRFDVGSCKHQSRP